jgi:hypothetical protein
VQESKPYVAVPARVSLEDELDVAFANAIVTTMSSRYPEQDGYRKCSWKKKHLQMIFILSG